MEALLEQPLVSSPVGAPPKRARVAVSLCFLLNGVLIGSWISRIPAVQSRLGLSPGQLGLSLLGLGLGAVFAMPVAGWAAARWGSRLVTMVCAVIFCLLLPLLAVAPNAVALSALLLLFGAVHGGLDIAMNAQAVAVEQRYPRPIMSSFHALWSLGGLLGSALGGLVVRVGVAPPAHFFGAALLFGGGGFAWCLPRLLDTHGSPQAAARRSASERGPRLSRQLVALGTIAFCVMMGEGAMADWSAIFLRDNSHASEALAAAGYAAFSLAMAACRFGGDWLTAELGGVRLLRWSGALAAVGLLLALLLPHPAAALIGFAAVGAGFATVVPVVFSAAGRTARVDPAVALATTTTLGYTGFLLGPPIIGFLAEWITLRGALGLIVLMSALLVALAGNVREQR